MTRHERAVLEAIRFATEGGFSPTVKGLCETTGLGRGTVERCVARLLASGACDRWRPGHYSLRFVFDPMAPKKRRGSVVEFHGRRKAEHG